MLIIDVYAPYRGDELRVRNQFLDGNLLIPTIATDGFSLVVDLDGPEQLDEFKELALSHGGLPETAVAETGRGCHIWFKTASKIRSRQVGNILFRGESGYVLVPNSRHKSGKIYKWVRDVNLSNVPDWLEAYINEGAQIYENRTIPPLPDYLKKSQQATRSLSVTAKGLQALARQWNQQEEARIRSALAAVSASCRREPWLRIGMALHSLEWVASDGSDRGFEIWREWSSTCPEKFSDHDVETRWRSFKRTGITIGTLFHIAAQFGWTQPLREVGPVAAAKGRDFDPSPAGPATGFSGVSPGALRADHVADNVPVDFHTDVGNAKRFVRRHHENIRFIHEWKKWIIWDGNRWRVDNDGGVVRLAIETVLAMYGEALQMPEPQRTALIKQALKSQAEARLSAMISLSESESEVVLPAKTLDSDPWLLGVQNGVIDLKKAEFRAGRREDFITKQAGASYDPNARCLEWSRFLDTVTGGNKELQAYLQRTIGYTMTGSVEEEVVFVPYGTGVNGKSTFRETVHKLHGDYAIAADAGLLTERKTPGGATEEIARLKGRRFVAVNETNENDQLHEARIKFITSQDTITARNLYGHLFDFFPTHKTFVTTNHKPIVRGTDEGIWRRLHLIPFTVTIPKSAIEKDFRERRLMPELAGILNWAIEGALAYFRKGLNPPAVVRAATDEYRQDMDLVGQWLEERCLREPGASIPSNLAYRDYADWAAGETRWTLTRLRWRRNLTDRGFEPDKGTHGQRIIRGLRLKVTGAPAVNVIPGGRQSSQSCR